MIVSANSTQNTRNTESTLHSRLDFAMIILHILFLSFGAGFGNAFTPPPPSGPRNRASLFGHNNGDDQNFPTPAVWAGEGILSTDEIQDSDISLDINPVPASFVRGGNSASTDVVRGSQATLTKVNFFWKNSIDRARAKIQDTFKSKEQKKQEELFEQLKTMPIRSVTVVNSTVLPPEVVRVAVKRSGLIGSPLRTDRVQEMAKNLKRWYLRKGYVLHTVTGATLRPETATAEIQVEEPKISMIPVDIITCKEMVVDEGGDLLTFRQYKEKHAKLKSFRYDRIEKKDLNTTYVQTNGRTKPTRIAKALLLRPGKPFQWHAERWQKIASSGIFNQILRSAPVRMPDGTVRLQVFVTEPAPRHLEYGLGKSLYTGAWEGELDFEHQNVFGGGETVGFMVRRGTKDPAPSLRVHFGDENFGLEGGYNFELFRDYIGDNEAESLSNQDVVDSYNKDSLLDRRGATFRLRNPIDQNIITNSVASASLERTSTTTGLHESIGSATLTLGPFRKALPRDARSSITTSVTGGSRFAAKDGGEKVSASNIKLLPYSTVSATTKQIFPIASAPEGRKPLVLALQHTVSTSTRNIPRHEAKAMGVSAEIRGASPNGRASSSVKGTAEVRIPIDLPKLGDGSVVFFGDWFCVQEDRKSRFYGKSSIGVGLRKNVSGLPLKYEICYSNEKKIKAMFGLGPEFDV